MLLGKTICKDHFERWILQLLGEVVIEQSLLELINRATGLGRQVLEPDPDQEGATNVVALNPGFSALAAFQPCHLLAFAVQLLNPPAEATRLLCRLGGILSGVVGHDPVRAVDGHLNPEQVHLVVLQKLKHAYEQ